MKKYTSFMIYLFLFIYLEFTNKVLMFNKLPNQEFLFVIFFSCSIAFFFFMISRLGKEKTNKRMTTFFVIGITGFYLFNFLYFTLFSVPFSVSALELTNQALDFYEIGFHLIKTDFVNILLFLLPVGFYFLLKRHFEYTKFKRKQFGLTSLCLIFTYLFSILLLNLDKEELYSPYNLYYNLDSLTTSTEVLGVFTSERLSLKRNVFGFQEKMIFENKEEKEEPVQKYNQLDIDFSKLIEEEKDENIKSVYTYLKNKDATNQNKYTGLYKGKNLIFILAEGFNSIAVDKERTPTLYQLIHEGFYFTNYYSPVFLSTTGGEFQAMTSLIPSQEILGMWRKKNIYFPYSIGNCFSKEGYNASSFHNWSYTYYGRDHTMPILGFPNYTACGNGLENKLSCKWIPSDVDLINETFSSYSNQLPFVTYYITVSGHAPYNFTGGNSIAIKNQEFVNHLPYSDSVKAYLASQLELEFAMQALINNLKEAGLLEDTVIVLTGDHYPYTLTEQEINEVSDYEREEIVEVNHSNLIIWNPNNEHVVIDKVASQIDVLPTILNLFGIEYDSRLLIGHDIFSEEEGIAIFSNRSWITNKGVYYKNKGFIPKDTEVAESYVKEINNRVANSFIISKTIVEKDIYRKIVK